MKRFSREKLIHSLKHYTLNLILIWGAILFYRNYDYYVNLLRPDTQAVLFYLALAYTVLGFLFYVIMPIERIHQSKGSIIYGIFKRALIKKELKLEKQEKVTLLFLIVKIFFLPLMINFFFSNYYIFKSNLGGINGLSSLFSISSFNMMFYPIILSLIFLIDTLWFSFGYAFESGILKNTVRSVEPTFLGWAVALICYPPFNAFIVGLIPWYANDYVVLSTPTLTFILRILMVVLFLVYVSATLALGTKCSNLTNRGIVSRGPYKYIRHPAYISKTAAWWVTIIPFMNLLAFFSMLLWTGIYYLRAITEENHLMKDPDYQKYCKKVKYKFIPGLW
ncbi:hypothetical protein BMS3Abin17_00848 [archaeon BMS3Abin17]|nr:hypothetical protein BMS3Abin17_00848 [archaeon BMS3Abin17]